MSLDKHISDNDNNDKLDFNFGLVFQSFPFNEVVIGELNVPSGQIVAGDAFMTSAESPFNIKVKPGKYPVNVLIYTIEENHHRIAFARLKIQNKPAIRWTLALTDDISQDHIDNMEEGEYFGYGVDAGLGCFADIKASAILDDAIGRFYKEKPTQNYYDEVLAPIFLKTSGGHPLSRGLGDWAIHYPNPESDLNIIMFASGWGDGYYPTYWGYSADGEIVELITDFCVVTRNEED